MRERIRQILEELESINHEIQHGGVDPHHLMCFKDFDKLDIQEMLDVTDRLIGDAFSALEPLYDMMKENS